MPPLANGRVSVYFPNSEPIEAGIRELLDSQSSNPSFFAIFRSTTRGKVGFLVQQRLIHFQAAWYRQSNPMGARQYFMAMSEYICAQCWHSFEADADLDEALKCPSCGAEQPAAGGASASEAEADSEEGAEHPAVPDEVRESSEGGLWCLPGRKSQPGSDEWSCGGRRRNAVEDGEEDGDWFMESTLQNADGGARCF